jgi:hypothetical protein
MVLCDHDLNIEAKQKHEVSTAYSEICAVIQNQFSHSPKQLQHLCAMTQNQFSYSPNQLHHLLQIGCTTPLHDADNSCDIPVPSGNSCRDNCNWRMSKLWHVTSWKDGLELCSDNVVV